MSIAEESLYSRTELLLGASAMQRLKEAHVMVAGLGGVGGYAAEMLCRAGVGELTLVDSDAVSVSNINRQIVALHSTVGQSKVELFRQRFSDINPDCKVHIVENFLRDEAMVSLLESGKYSCVVDAIDTLSPKVFLLYHAHRLGLPVVSSMGSAGKTDAGAIQVSDIGKSHTCPLAAMVRKRLHRLGVGSGITVVFSTEKVAEQSMIEQPSQNKRTVIGTISYLPAMFGCRVAAEVINKITQVLEVKQSV